MKKREPVSEAARLLGKRGGQKTLEKYGPDQLKEWGKRGAKFGKFGGRPRKSPKPKG
jgi:hypothetical protein